MNESLWAVNFSSNLQDYGSGVITINNNKIVGGDGIYYYLGSCTIDGTNVSAIINVKKHGNGSSVFGPIDAFTLNLAGTISNDIITLRGTVVQNPSLQLNANLKKLVNL